MNEMKRCLRRIALLLWTVTLCAMGTAEELPLNDMAVYEDRVQEELQYFEELYDECDGWKVGATLLDEAEYAWIGETRELLNRYFADTYQLDVSQKTAGIEVYTSTNLPESIGGFSDGENHVYLNQSEIERVPERMLQTLTHEMLHALGVDFYWDESGMLSNGFFEGATEAAVQIVLEAYDYPYEDYTGYDEVRIYAAQILQADPTLIFDLAKGVERDIAGRIDALAGDGCGKTLLKCSLLLSTGPDAPEIGENCALIAQKYAEKRQEK